MAGLYAITTAMIERLKREHFGRQFSQEKLSDGQMHEDGVQEFVDEFLAGLADQGAIQMPATLELVAPQNAPAITIFGDEGITIINNFNEEITLNFETINNITNIVNNAVAGVTGGIQVLSDVTVDVSSSGSISISGCSGTVTITNTVTVTKTYTTLNFTTGLLTSTS